MACTNSNRNQRRRRGIFVEPKPKTKQAPSGAAYSEFNAKPQRRKAAKEHRKISLWLCAFAIKNDVAPTELDSLASPNYKDASPTGFEIEKNNFVCQKIISLAESLD
jgi:hypothetical protein